MAPVKALWAYLGAARIHVVVPSVWFELVRR
jgi:hypothetical protein